jgi:hypothetical protein
MAAGIVEMWVTRNEMESFPQKRHFHKAFNSISFNSPGFPPMGFIPQVLIPHLIWRHFGHPA